MAIKLRRIAGLGPAAGYVSAGALFVFFVLQQFGGRIVSSAPSLLVPVAVVYFLALSLWIGGLAIVALDLARLVFPETRTRSLRVARWATAVAMLMPVPLLIGLITNAGVSVQSPTLLLLFGGAGISLVLHNLDAHRAGDMPGVLLWLGIVTGVAFIVGGIGFGAFTVPGIGMVLYSIGFDILLLGEALYFVWAIWMSVQLSRANATPPVPAI